MTFSKRNSAGYLANHMARIFERGLAARIKPLGLSTGTFPALLELWEEDGLSQKQLVERLDIEQATMANTLSRMERDGLIRRKTDETDRRVQRVWLTQAARDKRGAAIAAANETNDSAMAGLTAAEQDQFRDLMRKLIDTYRAAPSDEGDTD
ncbi:MarR family winged helix-turn-helix transcriptional regulator [Paracoccus albus]|uniref:MarR family winged helix-turn-helix transcriptional regulator n=1 Tax=Paracoccus albus TaxID=3017784 RepID=UPI0022F0FA85|nr:MarR family transcriptional regulator [Paracoccus albus]WBU61335.1 MarR family transcriptional regulator [Paracoccus albus]